MSAEKTPILIHSQTLEEVFRHGSGVSSYVRREYATVRINGRLAIVDDGARRQSWRAVMKRCRKSAKVRAKR